MQISEKLYLVGSEQFAISHLLDCNCYLLDCDGGLVLVDTGLGFGVDDIAQNIVNCGFRLQDVSHILITHAHLGHWGGAARLRDLTGAEVWAPAAARYWMEHPDEDHTIHQNLEHGRWPADLDLRTCSPDHVLGDGDTVHVGRRELRAIVVQGHTKDSTCFLWEFGGRSALITGDVVFYSGTIGLINAEGSSLDDYRRDMPKLGDLGIDMLLPGHSVFMLRNGQKHIDRAIRRLTDFVLPEMFFETNEFMWQSDYASSLTPAAICEK
jgi:glyoxylase-like metal-dependent hydrolase (beta-lactamase superfamily II)